MSGLHDAPPGSLRGHTDVERESLRAFVRDSVRLELRHFEHSGDINHVWRAWRTARALAEPDREVLDQVAPYIDKIAGRASAQSLRAEQRAQRNYILLAYYHELRRHQERRPGAPATEVARYRKVARDFGTSPGAVKQMVMEHEGRGQRGRRR